MSTEDLWYGRLTRGAPLAVLLAAALFIGYELIPVLELVAISALIALVLRTVVNFFSGLGLKPWLSSIVLIFILCALLGFIWVFVVPSVVQELNALVNSNASGSLNSLTRLFQQLHDQTGLFPDVASLSNRLKGFLDQELQSVPRLAIALGGIAVDVVAVLFLSVYFSISPGSLINGGLRFVRPENREEFKVVIENLKVRLRGWILGTVVAMLVVGTGVGAGLWAIGVPLPFIFGILAGLLELVPYVGQVIAAIFPLLVALTISPVKALLVVVLFLIVDQLDGQLIQPLVMGHQVRLHPAVVLISFLALGSLLGLAGVVLAVPAAAFVAVLLEETVLKNESSREKKDPDEQRSEEEPLPAGSGSNPLTSSLASASPAASTDSYTMPSPKAPATSNGSVATTEAAYSSIAPTSDVRLAGSPRSTRYTTTGNPDQSSSAPAGGR